MEFFPRRIALLFAFSAAGFFLLVSVTAAPAWAQQSEPGNQTPPQGLKQARPVPYPVMPSAAFQRAVQKGTRTPSGKPGPDYWTNTAQYDIEATLNPESATLEGSETIRYQNNSPNRLNVMVLHLRQNLHREGAVRNREVQITGGMQIESVAYGGMAVQEQSRLQRGQAGYVVNGTRLIVALPEPLAPGDRSQALAIAWSFEIPEAGAPRMGQDGEVFYLGYWYPQLAVYDDLSGWIAQPYQGNGEFYMGYADYDVAITAPEDFLVQSTGTLQNPNDVLTRQTRRRLEQARTADSALTIVGEDERGAGSATKDAPGDTHTWRFTAEKVRDVAFGASDRYVWDATRAPTGDSTDGTAMIHAFYRPEKEAWQHAAEYARFSIEDLSDMIIPYPYAHMTAMEGLIGGGMEYPMMTLIGGASSPRSLFGVTYHEISHMWFPMIVGSNEKRFTWMDEGITSFNTSEGEAAFYDENTWEPSDHSYYRFAGSDLEVASMRHADDYPTESPARVLASYDKPAVMLNALRGILGEETFFDAYQTYARRWAYKHPTPYDLFNTFEDVAGRDLDWFWRPAFYETWTLDQAVAGVEQNGDVATITIEDEGLMPMPVPLKITFENGSTTRTTLGVDSWLNGQRTAQVNTEGNVVERVEIDPQQHLPDTDRSDNTWTGDQASGTR